jgi:hypothetical protein
MLFEAFELGIGLIITRLQLALLFQFNGATIEELLVFCHRASADDHGY